MEGMTVVAVEHQFAASLKTQRYIPLPGFLVVNLPQNLSITCCGVTFERSPKSAPAAISAKDLLGDDDLEEEEEEEDILSNVESTPCCVKAPLAY